MANDPYLTPYRESVKEHGSDFKVTLWASKESQYRRFRAFSEMCFLAGKRILDAGSSRGDFAQFLLERDIPYEKYIGIDGLDEVIDFANSRGLPGAEFHAGDMLRDSSLVAIGKPQVICISGTLNTMTDDEIAKLLDDAWDATSEVLMFNFLSNRVGTTAPRQLPPARRLDTLQWMNWALERCCLTSFRQDYFYAGHDATIMMRKGEEV
jgi:hypothetical protein